MVSCIWELNFKVFWIKEYCGLYWDLFGDDFIGFDKWNEFILK